MSRQPRPGDLYRPRAVFSREVLWVVTEVDPAQTLPVAARRCDADDQQHVGRWQVAVFSEEFERVVTVPAHGVPAISPVDFEGLHEALNRCLGVYLETEGELVIASRESWSIGPGSSAVRVLIEVGG